MSNERSRLLACAKSESSPVIRWQASRLVMDSAIETLLFFVVTNVQYIAMLKNIFNEENKDEPEI